MYSSSEQTFVVFGNGQRLQSDAEGEAFSGTDGITLAGVYSFSGVGDVNGDGMGYPHSAVGRGLTLVLPLSEEQLAAVYDDIGSGYNASVAGGFDLNSDGVDDIAIGASRLDWIAQSFEARTYVVYGSAARSAGVLDLTTLDGVEGLRISAAQSSLPAPDRISAVGDVDAEGHIDFALVGDDGTAFVFYATQGMTGPVIDRENLPEGIATQLTDSSGDSTIAFARAVGDLDGDAADELGIEFSLPPVQRLIRSTMRFQVAQTPVRQRPPVWWTAVG